MDMPDAAPEAPAIINTARELKYVFAQDGYPYTSGSQQLQEMARAPGVSAEQRAEVDATMVEREDEKLAQACASCGAVARKASMRVSYPYYRA